tara:strand:- start:17 stop:2140 length:2124 start_codon:yes stop_codon:yes gene_type:complete
VKSDVLPIRVESGRLILPENIGSRVENMFLTEEGTLRSVWGPAPFVPNYGSGNPTYTNLKGIYHARVGQDGEQDILLIQDADKVRIFEGWEAGSGTPNDVWDPPLIAPTGADLLAEIGSDDKPRFPCQFESTPNGIVIIPSGESSRPFFFDGEVVLPLGYDSAPASPEPMGPEVSGSVFYDHDGGNLPPWAGRGRVGSLSLDSVATNQEGRTARSGYRYAVQWIDRWGNLSPLSGESATVDIPGSASGANPDDELKILFVAGIDKGPDGTRGRFICRTRDVFNAGTLRLFEIPGYSSGGFLSPPTLPDNVATGFPDNVPDSWLLSEPHRPVHVVPFKLYTLAFGRGWAANFRDDPGKIHPSMPGRWGTFLEGEEIYPDPRGAEITGMCQVQDGLLVFTENTTFIVVVSFGGEGFQTRTLHPTIGCVAPSSIKTLPDGTAVWLGREGFYAAVGSGDSLGVRIVSEEITPELKNINKSRRLQSTAAMDVREKKYRCWVPMEGSLTNNVCWEFDGTGWTRRTDVEAADVCVTQDHRAYMIAGGRATIRGGAPAQGVWLLDHQVQSWLPFPRASIVETCWLRSGAAGQRGSPTTIYLWFREMSSGTVTIEVQRDWKSRVVESETAPLYPTDDTPPFWGTATYGGTDADGNQIVWEKRRPYWTRVDISIPSCEVFRLKITLQAEGTNPGFWEFIGMSFDEVPHPDTFRGYPK